MAKSTKPNRRHRQGPPWAKDPQPIPQAAVTLHVDAAESGRSACPICGRVRVDMAKHMAAQHEGFGTLPPLGALIADDDGERIQCHMCGSFFRQLGIHVWRMHRIAPADYRERYGLNRCTSLVSPASAARYAASSRSSLEKVRPQTTPIMSVTRAERGRWAKLPRRLETRIKQAALAREVWVRRKQLHPDGELAASAGDSGDPSAL